jgi:thiosulfate reductase cytochrome b subunit
MLERAVAAKHHWLVRFTHWANIPLLLGLGMSGLSIYWASPVLHHVPDVSGNSDYFVDFGRWVVGLLPIASHHPGMSVDAFSSYRDDWFYNHFSLGTGELAPALRLHWLFVYLFMLNGALYLLGLGLGGGYKALLPRRTDLRDAILMQIYYVGLPIARVLRRTWNHPRNATKYNALQRAAYFSMPVFGVLAVLTGWAVHKPQQLAWLAAPFGGYDWARVWHFWIMWAFAAFVIPHVVLVFADGWDTFRSMVVGWSDRFGGLSDER